MEKREQGFTAFVGTIIFLLVALLCFLWFQKYKADILIAGERTEIAELKRKVAEAPQNGTIDQQAACSKQADLVLKDGGWKPENMALNTNHYNPKMNQCFVEIDSTDAASIKGKVSNSKVLSDAFENKVYGSYVWISQEGKKYWEVKPMECWVLSKSGEKQRCESDDEFNELAKQYLQ